MTHRRQNLFAGAAAAQIAFDDVAFYTPKFKAASLAYVIMPDHMHRVITPSPEDFKRFAREEQARSGKYAGDPARFYLSKIIEDYKRHVSFAVNKMQATPGAKLWQDGFQDDGLRTPEAIWQAVRYVLFNPVRAGLATRPEAYPYLTRAGEWLV